MTRRGARASRGRARPWPLPLGRCAGRVGSGTRRSGPGRSGGALLLRCRPPCPMGVTGVTSIYRGGERGLVSPPVFKTGAPRRLGGRVRFPSASARGSDQHFCGRRSETPKRQRSRVQRLLLICYSSVRHGVEAVANDEAPRGLQGASVFCLMRSVAALWVSSSPVLRSSRLPPLPCGGLRVSTRPW